jgi:hypothetical protein
MDFRQCYYFLTLFSTIVLIFNIIVVFDFIVVLDFVDHFAQNWRWCLANYVTRETVSLYHYASKVISFSLVVRGYLYPVLSFRHHLRRLIDSDAS